MKKIIITGATSMIGSATLREYLRAGDTIIYAVVRPNSKNLHRIPQDKNIRTIECEVNDYKDLPTKIPDKCDIFFHFAWDGTGVNKEKSTIGSANNIIRTLEALTVAKYLNCTKFIGAGSQAEYGRLDLESIDENCLTKPLTAYGVSKYAAGQLAMIEAQKIDISCIWVRIFSVYGIYDRPNTMVSMAVDKISRGEKMSFTPALQRWDYLNCDDAGKAFYLLGEKAKGHEVYCLGSGQARQLKEFIETMRNIINPQAEIGIGDIPYKGNEVMNLCADITKIEQDTGWKPSISFEDGIRQLLTFNSGGGYAMR